MADLMKEIDLPVAKEVLRLCRVSFDEFKKDQPTGDKWKLHYFSILTMLRTVREGLNEDKKLHPNIEIEINKFHNVLKETKPKPEIYWQFICEEANKLLHEFASPRGAGQSSDAQGNRLYTIKHGPFEGRDQRCVIEEAIYWWDEQLEDIINKAAAR